MASSRYRSRRSVGNLMNRVDQRLQYVQKRPAPRRLQPYSIFTQALARHAVKNENIGSGAVDNDKIADDSIDNDKMQADSITANEIVANTITANEIMANTITADEIMAGTITADEIAAGTITATQIAANTITGDEITANVKLEAPLVYGGGLRAYDIINPDPATYIGTVPSPQYVAMKAQTYPSGSPASQITCYAGGTIALSANSFSAVTINGIGISADTHNHSGVYATTGHNHDGVYATAGHTHPSDLRVKQDVEPINAGLSLIESLNPVQFKYIGDGHHLEFDDEGKLKIGPDGKAIATETNDTSTHYGLIAQEVKSTIPGGAAAWVESESGIQNIKYDEFIAPLIKAVQELSAQNKRLAEEVAELRTKLQ